MKFLQELLDRSRLLAVLYDNLPSEIKSSDLYRQIGEYLEKYTAFNSISPDDAIDVYTRYISAFNKHCKQFDKTGKYPAELGGNDFEVSREEYDIVLILSILFTQHRFRIMQLMQEQTLPGRNALYIGLGSGLEMELTKAAFKEIHAYDLSVNKFLYAQFPDTRFNVELFEDQYPDYFDAVYLIELLEHLADPYRMLDNCHRSLKKGGRVYLTTATDIPQFDHLYNFPFDHGGFESMLSKSGFSIVYKEVIPHHYLLINLRPCNHFYTIEKV